MPGGGTSGSGSPAGGTPGGGDISSGGQGGAGGVGGLDDEFDRSLGDFDDGLLEEQADAAKTGRKMDTFERGRAGGGAGGGTTSGGIVVANEPNGQSQGGGSGGSGQSAPNEESTVGSMSTEQIGERTPDDVDVGYDDDAVATMLREAAIAEEDPELRERLWEEYRNYKGIN